MKLYLSIDLESWVYPEHPDFIGLDSHARKQVDNGFFLNSTNEILDLLDYYNQRITFFAIAEVWNWYPGVFNRIINAGHEVAYHTHRHTAITGLDILRKELNRSHDFLKEFQPKGFRAPEIYLPREVIHLLIDAGFCYSSSIHGSYNDVLVDRTNNFCEFPVSTFLYKKDKVRQLTYPRPMTFRMLQQEIPFGSGCFFTILPLNIIDKMIERYFNVGEPVFMFVHSWQIIKPIKPSFPDFKYKLLHPYYLPYTISMRKKFEYLLKTYECGKMEELYGIKRILEQKDNRVGEIKLSR